MTGCSWGIWKKPLTGAKDPFLWAWFEIFFTTKSYSELFALTEAYGLGCSFPLETVLYSPFHLIPCRSQVLMLLQYSLPPLLLRYVVSSGSRRVPLKGHAGDASGRVPQRVVNLSLFPSSDRNSSSLLRGPLSHLLIGDVLRPPHP